MTITTPYDAGATADQVSEGIDLSGKRAIVSGGASGIGIETARTLARRGAAVTLAVRASVAAYVAAWDGPLHPLTGGARVVSLSSSGHLFSPVVLDDSNFRFRPYDPMLAYGRSKTAVNLFAVAATARWASAAAISTTTRRRHRPASIAELVAGVADHCLDPANADRLWALSTEALS
jgi:NAD(P)-dependent dehydrogenase (short-subunit alcohol dehydrogenase family)